VRSVSGAFRLYYGAVVLAGAVALAGSALKLVEVPWYALLAWVFVIAAVDLYPVSLPRGGFVTVSPAFDYAAIVVFGPAATAWIEFIATVVVRGLIRRSSWKRTAFNAALFAATVYLSGTVYVYAGGLVGSISLPQSVFPLTLCGVTFFAVNSAAVSLAIGMTEGVNPWRVWRLNYVWTAVHLAVLLSLGALMAVVYLNAGLWGLVLFGIPLVFARHAFRLYADMRRELYDFVRAMSDIIEEVDVYTKEHSQRVADYAVALARAMKLSEKEVQSLEYAALVHDLGKVAWSNRGALTKKGELSKEEKREMVGHPRTAANIMIRVKALRRASQIVRYHHERPDGKGYPLGLPGHEVPLSALILNVADAFDAMTSDRPYRSALSDNEALEELNKHSGTQFDNRVVECLMRLYEQGKLKAGGSAGASVNWVHTGW
jgi:HD-GYP domain-containing protein (c-di-GMP phosphodiesterase class II)